MASVSNHLFPDPVPVAGVRIVFVSEPVAQGAGFPVVQTTAADGQEQCSVILDCQQQLFIFADLTPTGHDVVFHDQEAEEACSRLPRTCPAHPAQAEET